MMSSVERAKELSSQMRRPRFLALNNGMKMPPQSNGNPICDG